MSQSKGFERERELVNMFYQAGFKATRVPKSGGGTQRELPDVLVGNRGNITAIEAKSRKEGSIYLTGTEVEALVYFSRGFGARPRIGIRYDYEDWYFFHPGDLHVTNGGNYRVKKETAIQRGEHFEDFIENHREGQYGV